MTNMKKEDIDNLINESYMEIMKKNIIQSLAENIEMFSPIFKDSNLNKNYSSIATYCLACIQTAQINSINTIREIMYKLCCEDDDTENRNDIPEMTTE